MSRLHKVRHGSHGEWQYKEHGWHYAPHKLLGFLLTPQPSPILLGKHISYNMESVPCHALTLTSPPPPLPPDHCSASDITERCAKRFESQVDNVLIGLLEDNRQQ